MKRLLNKKYNVKTSEVKTKEGCWSCLKVEIFQGKNKIGEYKRNYPSLFNTFYPFEWNGKDYALYSPDYETTSLMTLPACKLISKHNSGFCPVDFCVPDDEKFYDVDEIDKDSYIANMAIVAGCAWGDDSGGWKIKAVNLKDVTHIKVEPIFGYCQLHSDKDLDESIMWSSWAGGRITLPLEVTFHFDKDNDKSGALGFPFEDIKHYKGDSWDNYDVVKIRDVREKK